MDESLLLAGGAVHDLHGPGGSLVLVLGQTILSPVELIVGAVQSLQHVVGAGHAATLSLGFLKYFSRKYFKSLKYFSYPGALEEDHVSAEDLHERVLVEGSLGEGSGDVVAVLVLILQHLPPLGVLSSHGLAQVHLGPQVVSVGLHVDLEVGVQHVHLGQDAGQVAHHGGNISLEVLEVHQELLEVLLSWLEESLSLSFVPVPEVLPGAQSAVAALEWVVVVDGAGQGLEGVVVVVDGEGQGVGVAVALDQLSEGVGRLEKVGGSRGVTTLLHGLLQSNFEVDHVTLAPASSLGKYF